MPEETPARDELMSVAEIAAHYQMGESTVWLWLKGRDLPRYTVRGQGKRTYFHRADVDPILRDGVRRKSGGATESRHRSESPSPAGTGRMSLILA